jgi:hypothetical protein
MAAHCQFQRPLLFCIAILLLYLLLLRLLLRE